MGDETIIYESQCRLCDAHKTDLGTLQEIELVVRKNFSAWLIGDQNALIISWFEQYKTDERMKYIEQSKQRTTEQIQKFKQANIKAVKKEG